LDGGTVDAVCGGTVDAVRGGTVGEVWRCKKTKTMQLTAAHTNTAASKSSSIK
jgi:hypothetical protein